jgi:putative DNA primase/helicase
MTTVEEVNAYFDKYPQDNYGVHAQKSGLFVIDIDPRNGGSLATVTKHIPELKNKLGYETQTGSDGLHLFIKYDPAMGKLPGKAWDGVDIKHNGYVVGNGSMHKAGKRYVSYNPWREPAALSIEQIRPILQAGGKATIETKIADGLVTIEELPKKLYEELPEEVKEGARSNYLLSLGGKLRKQGVGEDVIATVLSAYNDRLDDSLGDAEVEDLTRRAMGYAGHPDLEDAEVKWLASPELQTVRESCTDMGNAERFANRYEDSVRYVHGLGWHIWDKTRWKHDDSDDNADTTNLAMQTVERITDEARERASSSRAQAARLLEWSVTSKSRGKLESMLSVAKADKRLSARVDAFDADPYLLNCRNVTVDLRTGEIRRHDRHDMLTKVARVDYKPDAQCPTWLAHLDAVFCGDAELIAYFQRCVGYSLTGLTVEQVGFFLTGSGANGKSTTIEALDYAIGDYGHATDPVILLSGALGAGSKADALKADLVGVRFASMSENDAGTKLNQADFKRLIAGNPLAAKKLYDNPFTFMPVLKAWFDVNHLPQFDGTDDAMVRRIKNIPFNAKFKRGDSKTDGRRVERLKSEAEGILAWAVRGAVEWFARGGTQGSIGTCKAVEDATDEYVTENDPVGQFLRAEFTTDDPNAYVPKTEFRTQLNLWLETEKKPEMTPQQTTKEMRGRGFRDGVKKIAGSPVKVFFGLEKRLGTF